MTILDNVSAGTRSMVQTIVDKESVNYIEAGMLYGIVLQGRYNVSFLSILYNHAQSPQLKQLIKEAIDDLTEETIDECEGLLRAGDAKVPTLNFPEHSLENRLDIPSAAHLTGKEIAITLANNSAASQMALLASIHQCYQLEIAGTLRSQLNKGLDWNYRLLQLMLHQGWLPEINKVEH